MFFNLFKNSESYSSSIQDAENKEEQLLAQITYSFYKNDTSPIIDVQLEEYNDECIKALSNIVNTIGEEKAYLETIHIIRNAMFADKQEDYFISLVGNLTYKSKEKMINGHKNAEIDQPCIKPSEML